MNLCTAIDGEIATKTFRADTNNLNYPQIWRKSPRYLVSIFELLSMKRITRSTSYGPAKLWRDTLRIFLFYFGRRWRPFKDK